MEPADQRRDDAAVAGRSRRLRCHRRNGARRPAAGRRRSSRPAAPARRRPQWSPPTSGGTTRHAVRSAEQRHVPQWSPPTSGGTTAARADGTCAGCCRNGARRPAAGRRPDAGRAAQRRAAMEPADQRRDDARHRTHRVDDHAAMEPADQRRDDRCVSQLPGCRCSRAAMEPADQRRDDLSSTSRLDGIGRGRNGARRPAAGRPACTRPALARTLTMPQWSPPTSGGTTLSTRPASQRAIGCRNGARRPAAGRRSRGRSGDCAHDAAAMEPADQRRDDAGCRGMRLSPVGAAAMEPADQRRDDAPWHVAHGRAAPRRNGARRPAAGRPAGEAA